jgi:hypothetical protein
MQGVSKSSHMPMAIPQIDFTLRLRAGPGPREFCLSMPLAAKSMANHGDDRRYITIVLHFSLTPRPRTCDSHGVPDHRPVCYSHSAAYEPTVRRDFAAKVPGAIASASMPNQMALLEASLRRYLKVKSAAKDNMAPRDSILGWIARTRRLFARWSAQECEARRHRAQYVAPGEQLHPYCVVAAAQSRAATFPASHLKMCDILRAAKFDAIHA